MQVRDEPVVSETVQSHTLKMDQWSVGPSIWRVCFSDGYLERARTVNPGLCQGALDLLCWSQARQEPLSSCGTVELPQRLSPTARGLL